MVSLPAAKQNISPLIRFARWSALLTGVAYGAWRYSYLAKREVGIQQHENEIKEKYKQRMAVVKVEKENAEMKALGQEAGVVPK
ncbi:ATP synthase subunit e, mitochondrial [Aplysia californica]|uniref:ATP synthase F(0) complex subunit e, mitochondrial n=1 Tax=Aplysia californica TaxID=6500 RepID=A0ABM0K8X6_APLCA|nr:ATP synthase subunit e, mitochondrial [Aplysia californica]